MPIYYPSKVLVAVILRVMTLNIMNIVFACILLSLATNEVKGSKYLLIDLKDEDLPTIKPGKHNLVVIHN